MRLTLAAIIGVIVAYMTSSTFRSIMLAVIGLLLSVLSLTIVWFFVGVLLMELSK